jgi:hypothetical protein
MLNRIIHSNLLFKAHQSIFEIKNIGDMTAPFGSVLVNGRLSVSIAFFTHFFRKCEKRYVTIMPRDPQEEEEEEF